MIFSIQDRYSISLNKNNLEKIKNNKGMEKNHHSNSITDITEKDDTKIDKSKINKEKKLIREKTFKKRLNRDQSYSVFNFFRFNIINPSSLLYKIFF